MANIDDVAALAGVSSATVSRVLNQSDRVSPKTTKRVNDAIAKLEYVPNPFGRNLRRAETRRLTVICPIIIDDLLAGMYEEAGNLGYRLTINYITRTRDRIASYVETFNCDFTDGAILYSVFYNQDEVNRLASHLPIVQCMSYFDIANCCKVSIDEKKAAFEATSHLIELGKKHIGLIMLETPGVENSYRDRRMAGYRQALEANGIPFDPDLVRFGLNSLEMGYNLAGELLAQKKPLDAIFAVQDTLAFGAMKRVQDAGLRVPDDIAIVGFDDFDISSFSNPRITSIRLPYHEMGRLAVQTLVGVLQGEISEGRNIELKHELVKRESTIGTQT